MQRIQSTDSLKNCLNTVNKARYSYRIRLLLRTWDSSGLIIVSSVLKAFPNIEYVSWIGRGGLGALPLRIFSSVYWFMYCVGGRGKELTWTVSEDIFETTLPLLFIKIIVFNTFVYSFIRKIDVKWLKWWFCHWSEVRILNTNCIF